MGATSKVGGNKPQYDNLVAILAIAAVFALMGLAVNIAGRYAETETTAYQTSKEVQGYVRPTPASMANQDDIHNVFKNPPMPETGDLTVRMSEQHAKLLKQRFEQGVALLHAKQYEYAITALTQVIELHPKLPEAYVNIGFAHLELEQWDPAISAFTKASDLKPDQANAYYGLALALEGKEQYETALGAMRSYIHLSTPDDPFLAKARSALWEWEAQLGRIPGPKKDDKEGAPITIKGSPHKKEE